MAADFPFRVCLRRFGMKEPVIWIAVHHGTVVLALRASALRADGLQYTLHAMTLAFGYRPTYCKELTLPFFSTFLFRTSALHCLSSQEGT